MIVLQKSSLLKTKEIYSSNFYVVEDILLYERFSCD